MQLKKVRLLTTYATDIPFLRVSLQVSSASVRTSSTYVLQGSFPHPFLPSSAKSLSIMLM